MLSSKLRVACIAFGPSAHALCMKRKYNGMKKIPTLKTDQQAEAFLDQDLSDLDFSQFKTNDSKYGMLFINVSVILFLCLAQL